MNKHALDSIGILFCDDVQVTLPDGTLPRESHSLTAINLCPGLEDVISFGGSPDYDPNQLIKDNPRMAETMIITFGELTEFG